jgi:hypothetical protein
VEIKGENKMNNREMITHLRSIIDNQKSGAIDELFPDQIEAIEQSIAALEDCEICEKNVKVIL